MNMNLGFKPFLFHAMSESDEFYLDGKLPLKNY